MSMLWEMQRLPQLALLKCSVFADNVSVRLLETSYHGVLVRLHSGKYT